MCSMLSPLSPIHFLLVQEIYRDWKSFIFCRQSNLKINTFLKIWNAYELEKCLWARTKKSLSCCTKTLRIFFKKKKKRIGGWVQQYQCLSKNSLSNYIQCLFHWLDLRVVWWSRKCVFFVWPSSLCLPPWMWTTSLKIHKLRFF